MPTKVTTDIARAARALRDGALVAFATETVYGLGADATSDQAVAQVFAAKQRPRFNPLIAHVATCDGARALGRFNNAAGALADALWPGPLTLVVPRAENCPVSLLASGGLDSIALRVPGHDQSRALLARFGGPVAAPSANRSGAISPTCADHVLAGLGGRIGLVLDGGPCPVGVESTVISCLGAAPVLLRPGGLPAESAEKILGRSLQVPSGSDNAAPVAPGQLASHYAPRAKIRLNATSFTPGEAVLAFGSGGALKGHSGPVRNLSPGGDTTEAAANLFAMLHELDATGAATIAVMPVPGCGLGAAINDRLARAGAPRPPYE